MQNIVLCAIVLMKASFLLANNAPYINLSNYILKQEEIKVRASNIVNAETVGFCEDSIASGEYKFKNRKIKDAFVAIKKNFTSKVLGPMRHTGRNLDIAIITPDCYFKIITPYGDCYTLDGRMMSINGLLVNSQGYPYANQNNEPINIDIGQSVFEKDIEIMKDGTIVLSLRDQDNLEVIDQVGVFYIPRTYSLTKVLNGFYKIGVGAQDPLVPENYEIVSRYVRMSNVDPNKSISETSDLTTSIKASNQILSQHINMITKTIETLD